MDDVEAIERATLAAVPPQALDEHAGWLLPYDDGTVGRAHSAVPLGHAVASPADLVNAIARRYRERGLAPVFRIPDGAAFEALQVALGRHGYGAAKPTLVQVAAVQDVLEAVAGVRSEPARTGHDDPAHPRPELLLADTPPPGWADVFLGEGFDPVDGASRVAILQRSKTSRYAAIRAGGQVVAVGAGGFSHGWCSVHGMRTLPAQRGRGHARTIIAALMDEARVRGFTRAFLQVEAGNEGALALYRRLGFTTRWRYRYWA